MSKKNCYFCNSECEELPKFGDYDTYDCRFCGKYCITYSALSETGLFDNVKHIIAGYLEETKESRVNLLSIQLSNVEDILNNYRIPKTTMQKLKRLLVYCYLRNSYIGQKFITFKLREESPYKYDYCYLNGDAKRIGIAYTRDTIELNGMVMAMQELGWCKVRYISKIEDFILTAKGLSYAEELSNTNVDSNKVFVATEFHDDYNLRLEKAIKPACEDCGFEAFIISDEEFNNNINDEIIVGIKRSKFIVADFTHNNEGVYYEAGYAKGMGLEVIKSCNKNWFDEKDKNGNRKNKLHFDIEHDNLLLYKDYEDYKKLLKSRIRKTINGAILGD